MQRISFATIVTSSRGRDGKTLLARLLAENFILAGETPAIFDTDVVERTLSRCFSKNAIAIDIDRVTDQVGLFEALAAPSPNARVVDLTHRSFKKFFDLMISSDYLHEARERGVEPVVFYIPALDPDSFEAGRQLLARLEDYAFVVVENPYLGEIKPFDRRGVGYRALADHHLRMHIPPLDPYLANTVDDSSLSLSGFMRQPPADLSFEARDAIRTWLLAVFREISRVLRVVENPGDRSAGSSPRLERFSR
ncbi:MAG: hypothetical protein HY659_02675 [Rhizobiales bacterium]|nr:hypothetical protein [Hyphomicrobiales bacterium]